MVKPSGHCKSSKENGGKFVSLVIKKILAYSMIFNKIFYSCTIYVLALYSKSIYELLGHTVYRYSLRKICKIKKNKTGKIRRNKKQYLRLRVTENIMENNFKMLQEIRGKW